jgi:thiamine-phosphate pyrophosphorylase
VTGPLSARRLYLCTPDRPDLSSFVAACIAGGVDVVQLRDKQLEARAVLRQASELRDLCHDLGVPFIVNDRPDLALAADADGVHVGQEDAPPALARRILGSQAIVGLSTHSPSELAAALSEPVDYLSAGPVVPTPTKPGRPGTGAGYLQQAVAESAVPVFVTGGVTPDTVPGLVAAGARHFVAVRWLTEAAEPRAAAEQLRSAIDAAIDAATNAAIDAAIEAGGVAAVEAGGEADRRAD